MRKTIHVLALTLMLGGIVSGTFARSARADDDDDGNKFCSKFSRKIEKKARQGKSYEIDSRKLSQYRASCLGRGSGFSSNPGNYSSNNGYTYTRGSTTGSNDGNGSSRSSQSTYSSNTTNGGYGGGYTQQRSSQTNNSYDPYDDDYRDDGRRYDDRPSINVATPNSQVRVQNGGVTIRTRNTGGTGINLGF
jgi:hypothetical protein